jgi:RNA polymerase sigma-70 factor (ECF subfamily)
MSVCGKELLERARNGEYAAFERLVLMFQGRIRAFFAVRLSDPSLVDDLSQDVFLRAFERLQTFDTSRPFYPWLKGIANNILRNEFRKTRSFRLQDVMDPNEVTSVLERAALEQAEIFDRAAPETDVFQALRECLGRLKGTSAQMVQDRYYGRLSLGDISRRIGKSVKAVSVSLVRIRRSLRECIENKLTGGARSGGDTA